MIIKFKDVLPDGLHIEATEATPWVVSGILREEPYVRKFNFRGNLHRLEPQGVYLKGQFNAECTFPCDRCGENFETTLTNNALECAIEQKGQFQQKGIPNDDADEQNDAGIQWVKKPEFSLSELLRESLVLAQPFRNLCSENCKGLCTRCGQNLNTAACSCRPDDL